MNILIIGEFSAFAKHLKNGFKKLGHQVTIVHSGDTFKRIESDEDDVLYETKSIVIKGHHIPGSERLMSPWTNNSIQKGIDKQIQGRHVDLVIVVNFDFLTDSLFLSGIRLSYLKQLVEKGAKLIMTSCGNEPALHLAYPETCSQIKLQKKTNNNCYEYLVKNADAIIPTAYSYYVAIKKYCQHYGFDDSRLCHTTPLPMTVDSDYTITPCADRKVVIFHGITRPVIKGTPFIMEAMDRIQQEYPDKVECICKGGMPYNEYVNLFERIDILIDQTYFSGWGVNAAIGAMKGKCVLAPCTQECRDNVGIDEIPFIEIGPDSSQIYSVLKHLVENPHKIDEIKKASRHFIEKYCESSIIARRYIEAAFNSEQNLN